MKAPARLSMVLFATASLLMAQPSPAPSGGDAPCAAEPSGADTSRPVYTEDGFIRLFNGKDFTGWWHNCGTAHSMSEDSGAVFRVDTALQALYTTQRNGTRGGVLMTRSTFTHYELIFDYWPDFGNDAQVYHRSTTSGKAYATTLSYIGGTSIGGVWGANGFTGRDYRPYYFVREDSIVVGSSSANQPLWDATTSKNNPASYGCGPDGCKAKDWTRLWDIDGWNQIRVLFYGGTASNTRVGMKVWFKRPESAVWVPVMVDTTLQQVVAPGYIGLLVHGGGRFGGLRGTWYRNIRYRTLAPDGYPLIPIGIPADARQPGGRDILVREKAKDIMVIRSGAGHPLRTLSIHDMRGRAVPGLRIRGDEAEWDATGLPKGLYIVRHNGMSRPILR